MTCVQLVVQTSAWSNGERIHSCNLKNALWWVCKNHNDFLSPFFLSQWFVTIFSSQMSPSHCISLSNLTYLHLNKWDIRVFSFKPLLHIGREPKKPNKSPPHNYVEVTAKPTISQQASKVPLWSKSTIHTHANFDLHAQLSEEKTWNQNSRRYSSLQYPKLSLGP